MNVKKIITQFYTINLFHLLFLPFNHKTLLLNTYVFFFKFKVIIYPFLSPLFTNQKNAAFTFPKFESTYTVLYFQKLLF